MVQVEVEVMVVVEEGVMALVVVEATDQLVETLMVVAVAGIL
jgi:hypothetical protein